MGKKIRVFGLQRSGTNFLEFLIRKNLHVSYENEYCYNEYMDKKRDSLKHSKPKLIDGVDYYILIFKLKSNFITSFKKWTHNKSIKLNVSDLYDEMVQDYINFYKENEDKCILILYEDLYNNEIDFINFVGDKFGIETQDSITIPTNVMDRSGGANTTNEKFQLLTKTEPNDEELTNGFKELLKLKWIKK